MSKLNLVCGDYSKLLNKKKNLLVGDWLIRENLSKGNLPKINYHWENEKKIKKDIVYIFKTYKKFLKKITNFLNKTHKERGNEKYWEILIFNWLWQIIFFTFDRWEITKNIAFKYKNLTTKTIHFDEFNYIPFDNTDVIKLISSKSWNHLIFSKILKYYNIKNIATFPAKNVKSIFTNFGSKKKFKYYPKSYSKVLIKGLYLPKNLKLLLNLSYGQFNFFYNSELIKKKSINKNLRSFRLTKKKEKDKFHDFLNAYLPKCIPSIYLENYSDLKLNYKKINWPNKPEVILTSILHLSDPFFRFYLANKKKMGSKLVVLQHGGKYGYAKYRLSEFYESRVCDRFLSWGDYHKKKNYFNRGKYKTLYTSTVADQNITPKKNSKKKKILMTTSEFPFTLGRIDGVSRGKKQVLGYANFVLNFIEKLDKNLIKKLEIKNVYTFNSAIKPKKNDQDYLKGYSELEKKIKKRFSHLKIFYSKNHAFKIREKYYLQIETMDGTGFLESLCLNNPVILIYNPNYFQHDDNAKNLFKELEKVKIVFTDEKKAANFINENYDKLENWWNNKDLQKVKNIFCSQYAKFSNNPIKDLKKALKF